jgi:PadR family transcriptional regulator PadR
MADTNPYFMNGVPELLILQILKDREMYGYELVEEIRHRSDDVIAVGEGVVYPVLHALERSGALESRRAKVNGRSRVYYRITPQGSSRLAGLSDTWSRIADAIRQVMTGVVDAPGI